MVRFIVLVALVVLAVWLVRRALRAPRQEERPAARHDELVRCAHCGVHLPRAEARLTEGLPYCSEEHARLGRR